MSVVSRLAPLVALAALAAPLAAQLQWGGAPPSLGGDGPVRALLAAPAPTATMPPVDVNSYLAEDAVAGKDVPFRFGATLHVDLGLDDAGTWTTLPGGDRDWRLRIASHGAFSIGLLFSQYQLPPGAQLFVYDDGLSHLLGAYDDRNNAPDGQFAIEPVPGSAITLEYVEPAAVAGAGLLRLNGVVHDYRDLYTLMDKAGTSDAAGACETDVNCPSGAPWQDQKRAVTLLILGGSLCSGSLINNTANDGTQYYMSANHCGDMTNAVFRFNYEKSGCGSGSAPTNHTVHGSVNLASNATYDYHLVRITESIPSAYQPYYLGWNRTALSPSNTLCIHHPEGDVKKISFDNDPPTKSNTQWHIAQWDAGVTEPGSSGSPLMDNSGRFMGQLYGGASYCGFPFDDYYGRFDKAWTAVAGWLDPINTGATTLEGFDPAGGSGGGQPPTITLVTPSSVTDFQPGQVTLTGSHFTGASVVTVGGTQLATPADFTVNNDSLITLTAPGFATLGAKSVTVTNAAGTSSGASLNYVETLPPKIAVDSTIFGGQTLTWNFGGGSNDTAYLIISLDPSTFVFQGSTILSNLIVLNVQTLPANGVGSFSATVPMGLSFLTVYAQMADLQDGTNALLGVTPVVSTLIPL